MEELNHYKTIARRVSLPVLPIKNTVLFPHLVMPLSVGRQASLAAVDFALASEDKTILVVAQRDANIDEPQESDLYGVATTGVVKKMSRSSHTVSIIVNGMERVKLVRVSHLKPYIRAEVAPFPLQVGGGTEVEALQRTILDEAAAIQHLIQVEAPIEINQLLLQLKDPLDQVYLLATMLGLDLEKEQALLEAPNLIDTLKLMHEYLTHERQVLEMRHKISTRVANEMGKEQREIVLRKQLRAIQEELGETSPEQVELANLRKQIEEAKLPINAQKEVEKELSRLENLPPAAPDYQVTRGHIELIAELPWTKSTEDNLDLIRAREVLDEDHYDLKDVKDRILEQLAVLKLNPHAKSPILCFVGPPGTGKTSLGQSIAKALGRSFERMSFGGLHDEAELRGHRRTYIGAMPGRIIQAIRRAGVNNPLLMLDEIDKLGKDFRGDPSAALMEILDPAQNFAFHDNYLDLPFDLTRVFFITTANSLESIPGPLLDRMEILKLSGYTDEDKLQIAKRYLLPRQSKEAGLRPDDLALPDKTILNIIHRYTREAGLRQLERTLGKLARRTAMDFAQGKSEAVTILENDLGRLLGPEKFFLEKARNVLKPGVATGLAWTEAGGDILYVEAIFLETKLLPSRTGLTITGHLGEVMKESVETALSYILSETNWLCPGQDEFPKAGIHVHVPAGAIPKDGPSAGIAVAVALASCFTKKPVRKDTAMTGEITLTGLILPIGGVKEKVLAAKRADINRIVIPKANEKDLIELSEGILKDIEFIFVEEIEEALVQTIPGIPCKSVPMKLESRDRIKTGMTSH